MECRPKHLLAHSDVVVLVDGGGNEDRKAVHGVEDAGYLGLLGLGGGGELDATDPEGGDLVAKDGKERIDEKKEASEASTGRGG